jgi:hypothetical protein
MSEQSLRKPRLSITQLNMISKCGEQYRRRYIVGEKRPPAVAMLVGRAVDNTVTQDLTSKKDGNGLLPLDQVMEVARDSLNAEWGRGEVALSDDEVRQGIKAVRGEAVDKSVRLSRLHRIEVAPRIEPTHLQREVVVELPNYSHDLLGYIDIQEGAERVRDTKTSAKTPSADVAHKDDQLTLYALMVKVIDGEIPRELCLDYLVDTKTPKAESFPTERTLEDFEPMLRRVENAISVLEKGAFVPARESDWWCSPRWCGYWNSCPYVKKARRQ